MYELQREELEHKITLMRNKEIKLEAEVEQVNEKFRYEESKCRQLRVEYDELKFQFNRYKIMSNSPPRYEEYNRPTYHEYEYDFTPQNYEPYKTETYKPITIRQPPPIQQPAAAASVVSEKLYRKNMTSTVGDLLRWDSTKGVYASKSRESQSGHNKFRSVSNPPTQGYNRANYEPSFH